MSTLYRTVFGYDRADDLCAGHAVNAIGQRVAMGNVSSGHTSGHRTNPAVVLSEMGARARRPYGTLGVPVDLTDEERRWGMPYGTGLAMSAQRSRRSRP